MRLRILVVAVASIGGLLTGYGIYAEVTEPNSGTVTRREYRPAWDELTFQCVSYNAKTGACTSKMPAWHHWPECYRVVFRNKDSGRKGDACVAPTEYPLYHTGDRYPREDY